MKPVREFFCKIQVSECNLCLFVEFGNWEIHVFLNWHNFPCIVWKEIWISPFWGNFITKFLPYLKYRGNVADTPVKRSDIQSKSKHLKGRLEEACPSVSDVFLSEHLSLHTSCISRPDEVHVDPWTVYLESCRPAEWKILRHNLKS